MFGNGMQQSEFALVDERSAALTLTPEETRIAGESLADLTGIEQGLEVRVTQRPAQLSSGYTTVISPLDIRVTKPPRQLDSRVTIEG